MSQFLHPTVEVRDFRGQLKRLAILERSADGSRCRYAVLGCDATPVWISVEALRPLIQAGKVL